MISQNQLESSKINAGNTLFWKKTGQPTFIERHGANLMKAQDKEQLKKVNRSYDFNCSSQIDCFIPEEYDPVNKYLPKCLREQNFSQTQNIKEVSKLQNLQQYMIQQNQILPSIQSSYKNEKKNINIQALTPQERKKILSLDLTKLNAQNFQNSEQAYENIQYVNEQMSQNNPENDMELLDSPNISHYKFLNQNQSSSRRVRESLFLLPKPNQITKEQRKLLLDDLESAYFKFKKDHKKQRFFSSNQRNSQQKIADQIEYVNQQRNKVKLNPLHNQSLNMSSIINYAEASDLLEDKTIDSNRIQKIINQQDTKLKQRRKLSNEIREENGIKYPLRLYMMNNYRKIKIEEIIKQNGNVESTQKNPNDEKYMDAIWKNMPEYQKVVEDERNKRAKEINSRKIEHTPLYNVLSLNNNQKRKVEKLFQGVIPLESRFYAIIQNKDDIHYKKSMHKDNRSKQQQNKNTKMI
ncbi:hypothetical protein ABPG72_019712 [Tetrahymena utriculariae]